LNLYSNQSIPLSGPCTTMPSPANSPTNPSKPMTAHHNSYPSASASATPVRPRRRVAMFSEPTVRGESSSDEDEPRATSSSGHHDDCTSRSFLGSDARSWTQSANSQLLLVYKDHRHSPLSDTTGSLRHHVYHPLSIHH
jgi:hypothetical protein